MLQAQLESVKPKTTKGKDPDEEEAKFPIKDLVDSLEKKKVREKEARYRKWERKIKKHKMFRQQVLNQCDKTCKSELEFVEIQHKLIESIQEKVNRQDTNS